MKFPNLRLKEDVDKPRQIFLSLFKFGWNRAVRIRLQENFFFSGLGDIFVWLFCVSTREH